MDHNHCYVELGCSGKNGENCSFRNSANNVRDESDATLRETNQNFLSSVCLLSFSCCFLSSTSQIRTGRIQSMQTHTEYIRHTNRSERDHVLYCYSFIVDESDRTIIYGFVERVVRTSAHSVHRN